MEIQPLSGSQAFLPGADLWVIPQESEFTLFDRLDWYVNLLLSKALAHQVQEPSLQILDLLKKTEQHFNRSSLPVTAAHLFLVSQCVPAKLLLHLPYGGKLSDWATEIQKQTAQLKTNSLRIFLPKSCQELLLPSHFNTAAIDTSQWFISVVPPQSQTQ